MNTAVNMNTVKRGSVPIVHVDLPANFGSINYRGFAPRLPAVTREELEEASRLFVLAEQQRREGRAG
ncbi:hypothetical protein [Variovorax paradoxus]|uniref:Uncharacterized protein n=1 Tax=Variovorax paradoxus TaxID=34073 RepID=A0A679JCC7_VARPD|nr:hypothetical protein VVAX_04371 [Variovorax paradoxus]